MDIERFIRGALLWSTVCCALLSPAGTPLAATFLEFIDPHPATDNQFGATVMPLSTGNVVITSPFDDAGGTDAGAVYLFNGSTGALISTLRGATAGDQVGNGGVKALSNGNFVVVSFNWDNGSVLNAGAATWGSGTTGASGTVSAANSLVGSTGGDLTGNFSVTALSNGNYAAHGESGRGPQSHSRTLLGAAEPGSEPADDAGSGDRLATSRQHICTTPGGRVPPGRQQHRRHCVRSPREAVGDENA